MLKSETGSLTMLGLNTATPTVFWNGNKILNIVAIKVQSDERTVKLKIRGDLQLDLLDEMRNAGIYIKKVL